MNVVLATIASEAAPVLPAGTLLVLALVAFATAAFSAIVGMGGGIVLLAVLLFFLDPLVVIPLFPPGPIVIPPSFVRYQYGSFFLSGFFFRIRTTFRNLLWTIFSNH